MILTNRLCSKFIMMPHWWDTQGWQKHWRRWSPWHYRATHLPALKDKNEWRSIGTSVAVYWHIGIAWALWNIPGLPVPVGQPPNYTVSHNVCVVLVYRGVGWRFPQGHHLLGFECTAVCPGLLTMLLSTHKSVEIRIGIWNNQENERKITKRTSTNICALRTYACELNI